jgi:hypothetical protein
MDWVIAVSKSERAAGALQAQTVEAAQKALRVHGAALLRGAFPKTTIESLHKEFVGQFGPLDAESMKARALLPAPNPLLKVGSKRYDITPRMEGVLADPAVLANPLMLSVLSGLLGDDIRLGGLSIVASFPGAALQHIHRDHGHLFREGSLGTVLPAYAINVAVPLIDIDLETGPTGFWPGSHRWDDSRVPPPEAMATAPFARGDCIMMDYRALHTGLPNKSGNVRPILYMPYTREWFFDELNHEHRTSLNMSLETYLGLPEPARRLLLRVYSQAVRSKQVADRRSFTPGMREAVD